MIPAIGIGPLGAGEWSVTGVGSLGATPGVQSAGSSSGGSFSNALTSAIGSLESSQDTATTASQQLATGQLTDPTQAITAVENASLAMNFASQIRNQLDSAATTIFQTQA
jgi:flagellar hook-basal body complex protein FliE